MASRSVCRLLLAGATGAALGWALALMYMQRLLGRRLQGFTGDTLGATQQLCELGLYLGLALLAALPAALAADEPMLEALDAISLPFSVAVAQPVTRAALRAVARAAVRAGPRAAAAVRVT